MNNDIQEPKILDIQNIRKMNLQWGITEKFFRILLFTGLFLLASLAPNAFAGFVDMGTVWFEEGDAGQSVDDHQDVTSGSLTAISGTLSSDTDIDVYAIFINAPANFTASTVGGASFDTMRSLFDINGLGIRSNNDASGTSQSLLDASLDNTTIVSNDDPDGPLSPGVYFLMINLPRDIRAAPVDLQLIFTTHTTDNL